ncbi:MAG: hypothetical protein QXL82_03550 [Candidatus Aenigmatarchaeota archaeon]
MNGENKKIVDIILSQKVFTRNQFNLVLIRGKSGFGKTYTTIYLAFKYLSNFDETIEEFIQKNYVSNEIDFSNFFDLYFYSASCLILDEIDRIFENLHKDFYRVLNRIRKFFNKPIFIITHNIGDLIRYNRSFRYIIRYIISFYAPKTFKVYEYVETLSFIPNMNINFIGVKLKKLEYGKYVLDALRVNIPYELLERIKKVIEEKENKSKLYYLEKFKEELKKL